MIDPGSIDELTRWRLMLGGAAEGVCAAAGCSLSGEAMEMDRAMEWLYGREADTDGRNTRRQGGSEGSVLSTPGWIDDIHRLFPKETIERLERDAIERFAVDEIVTNLDVLGRAEPNETLLRAVLKTKHLMSPDVLAMARKLVAEVVRQLMEKLSAEMTTAFSGVLDRRRRLRYGPAASLDIGRVVRENLRHYDPASRSIAVEKLSFFARNRRHPQPWQVILLVDQSMSMVGSVIHSAVMASCLWRLPGIRTHLVAFDTEVVDLTRDCDDPCELLMKVQLGGGTDIQKAVAYGSGLIQAPERAIVVLITDFYEGSSEAMLVHRVRDLVGQRTKVLGLAALDPDAVPSYDKVMAARLVEAGAHVAAMTLS
jgi:hypothetical protein